MVTRTRPTRLDYCQYLVSSQINYTLTNFADHSAKFSHDQLNRLMRDDKLPPRLVWEQSKEQIIASPNADVLYDDTVADKNHSRSIQLVRRQWSGNTHSVIRGIGIVTCIYVNPELNRFWLIDYRIFAPDEDGKTKLDHAKEICESVVENEGKHCKSQLSPALHQQTFRRANFTGILHLGFFVQPVEKAFYRLAQTVDHSIERFLRLAQRSAFWFLVWHEQLRLLFFEPML